VPRDEWIWVIISVYRDSKKNLSSATNPTRLVQDSGPSIFTPSTEEVIHNFRNLPPTFLAVRYSQKVSRLQATTEFGKLSIRNFGVPKQSQHAEYNFSMEMAD